MGDAGWPSVTLADVTDVRLSSVDKKTTPGESRVRLCNYSDVYNNNVLRANMGYMEATASEREIQNCRLGVGDVVITKDSETPGDIGIPAVVRERIADLVCGYHLAILRPKKSVLDGEYLNYALATKHARRQCQMYANGITRFGLRAGDIQRISIPLPPLLVQRKVAAILSSVDDAIEKTQAVVEQVQVVKRGLMQELLTRGLPGRHTRFKQTEIGEVPEDWQVLAIGELGRDLRTVVRTGPFGSSMKTKDFCTSGVPVLTIQSLGENELHAPGLFFTSREKADELSGYTVAEGDLVFSRVADIGRSLAIDAALGGWLISPNLIRIRPDRRKADARFMMYAITLARVVVRQILSVSGNAGRPVVSSSILRSLRIPVPPLREQHEIARVGLGMERRIRKEAKSLALLEQVKSALMTVLFTGELRVSLAPEVAWP